MIVVVIVIIHRLRRGCRLRRGEKIETWLLRLDGLARVFALAQRIVRQQRVAVVLDRVERDQRNKNVLVSGGARRGEDADDLPLLVVLVRLAEFRWQPVRRLE